MKLKLKTPLPITLKSQLVSDVAIPIKDLLIEEATIEEATIEEAETAIEEVAIEEIEIEEVTIEEVTIEEVTIEEVTIEEVTIEEFLVEDVAIEDVLVEEIEIPINSKVKFGGDLSPLVMKGKRKVSPKKISPKKPKSKKNSFDKTNRQPTVLLHSVDQYQEKLAKFRKMPFFAQKTPGWLNQRSNYLTASSISKAISAKGSAARRELLLEKVSYGTYKPFTGGVATMWGNKYEPVANGIYSYRNKVIIEDFAMITNEKYPILGISPDGILPDRMIEIKCPYSRVLDGKVKDDYYHQMQEQMAVCEYDKCDFLEVKLNEIESDIFWYDFNDFELEKGIVMIYMDLLEKDGETAGHTMKYLYSPIEYHDQKDQMEKWYHDQLAVFQSSSDKIYLDEIYWKVDKCLCQTVYRNENWIPYFYPILEEFWADVEHYRKVGLDQLLKDIEKERCAESSDHSDNSEDDTSGKTQLISNKCLL